MIEPGRSTVLAGLVCFVTIVVAYVVLTLNGQDANGLLAAVVPLLGLLGLGVHVEARTKQQNKQLEQITRQTNGVLDKRILDGATTAVEDVMRRIGHVIPPTD